MTNRNRRFFWLALDILGAFGGVALPAIVAAVIPFTWGSRFMGEYYGAFQTIFLVVISALVIVSLRTLELHGKVRPVALGAAAGYVAGFVAYLGSLAIADEGRLRMENAITSDVGVSGFLLGAAWAPLALFCWTFGAIAMGIAYYVRATLATKFASPRSSATTRL